MRSEAQAGAQLLSIVSVIQGFYYVLTGVWPLLSRRTFERVTGPKSDFWLVQTVGVVVAVVGVVLMMAGIRKRIMPEIGVLAVGNAAGLAGIDLVYSSKGRISPVYAVEATAEFALMVPWLLFGPTWLDRQGH
jgi:hypothetical protein